MASSQSYDNELRGALFKNDRKEKDSHPDYKGQCQVDGVEYWVSAWIKEGRNGKFMSLSLTAKETQQTRPAARQQPARQQRQAPQRQATSFDDADDDAPF